MRIAGIGKALALTSMVAGGVALTGCRDVPHPDYAKAHQDESYVLDTLRLSVRDVEKLDSVVDHLVALDFRNISYRDAKRIVYGNFVDSIKLDKKLKTAFEQGVVAGKAFAIDSINKSEILKKAGRL